LARFLTKKARPRGRARFRIDVRPPYACRAIIKFLISAMALAGFNPLGQARAQFMIVWQR
jgi:hypothetical protein